MSAHNDGGPAFPANELNADGSLYAQHFGVSLRDYFAAKAMQALISGMTVQLAIAKAGATEAQHWVAIVAYHQADAMLAERAKAEGSKA